MSSASCFITLRLKISVRTADSQRAFHRLICLEEIVIVCRIADPHIAPSRDGRDDQCVCHSACVRHGSVIGADDVDLSWKYDLSSPRQIERGSIDLKDVVTMRRQLAGGWEQTFNAENADFNLDGVFNLKDVVWLRQFLAGWIEQPKPQE